MVDLSTEYEVFAWIILPLLIFFARICDVSLGTLRVIFISKGLKYLAPLIGFFEVIIWLLAIGQVMNNMTNVFSYIAYGGGFAAGTFIGMVVEERLSLGTVIIRVITKRDAAKLIAHLRSAHYGVTSIDAVGSTGNVKIIFLIVKRQNLGEVIDMIKRFNPHAFYSIEDVRSVAEGIFPTKRGFLFTNWRDRHGFIRKGK
ncbi:MAG TPA: DUF2179 domain-containing protein [Methanoregulaceae archaeon]|nr:DUF2179 domain-containing protein [Methanoregulaceae archaeon]